MNPYESPQTTNRVELPRSPNKPNPRRSWAVFGLAVLGGAGVWALSPWFTGQQEPWDSNSSYYPIAIAVAGMIAAFPAPSKLWLTPVGVAAGQLLFVLLFLPIGPLIVIGAFLMALNSLFAVLGGVVTVGLLALWRQIAGRIARRSFE